MNSGSHIGRYRILRLLREGGQGSVYLGYDEQLQRRVAVKLYRLPDERRARRTVLDEARTIASIDNYRVVQIHDVISAGDHMALVMAYVPGCDLEELLQRDQCLSLTAILNLAIDVSAALAVVRQRGLVHGDLKASNVLVAEDGRGLLTDFGIARATGGVSERKDAGSLSALSPEQVLGQRLDVLTDLFALGCLLYRMVSGRHPFLEDGKLSRQRLLEAAPEPLPATLADGTALPSKLAELIERLLQKRPAERYDNTHRVRQILRDLVRREPQSMAALPLAGVRSELRGHTEDELPPPLPRAFQGRLHFRLKDRIPWSELEWRDVWAALQKPWLQCALVGCCLALAALVWVLWPRDRHVSLQFDQYRIERGVAVPQGVGRDWLRAQLCQAMLRHYHRVRIYQAAEGCVDVALGRPRNRPLPPADESVAINLDCREPLCVLGLRRDAGGGSDYRQTILLSGMSLDQWSTLSENLVDELYRAAP